MRLPSRSAALGLLTDIVRRLGPDNIVSLTAATIYGSTETTFYVAAVYFGAVGINERGMRCPWVCWPISRGVIASVILCWAVL
jgi:spore maturation protein B